MYFYFFLFIICTLTLMRNFQIVSTFWSMRSSFISVCACVVIRVVRARANTRKHAHGLNATSELCYVPSLTFITLSNFLYSLFSLTLFLGFILSIVLWVSLRNSVDLHISAVHIWMREISNEHKWIVCPSRIKRADAKHGLNVCVLAAQLWS